MDRMVCGIRSLTVGLKWLALATLGLMVLLITVGVVGRAFGKPIIGDVELVQVMMVIVIAAGLAYAQSENAHISIGLVVDKFSPRAQSFVAWAGDLMTCGVCAIVGWVYLGAGITGMSGFSRSTDMLEIPTTPLSS